VIPRVSHPDRTFPASTRLRRLGAAVLLMVVSTSVSAPAAAVELPRSAAQPSGLTAAAFIDISGSIFRSEIQWMVREGLANGCTATRFCPDRAITRGELASFMVRARNVPPATRDFFRDDNNSVHEGAINAMAQAGLTGGCASGRYCPGRGLTRAELASFLGRTFGLPPTTRDFYVDDTWTIHQQSINRATSAGVASGCGTLRFCPFASVTRGQFAAFLYRAMVNPLNKPTAGPAGVTGFWVTHDEIRRQPTSGSAWNRIVSAASMAGGDADVSDQDSDHDQWTLAAAIYTVRTGHQRDRAVGALERAIGTEQGGRWLAVGRNLTGYIIAADLLGIRSGRAHDWLASFRTMRLEHNNSGEPITFRASAWESGSNASAQEGAAYTALAMYLNDGSMKRWSWDAFRRYAGDRTSPHRITSNSDVWQQVPSDPVGIQNVGARRSGCSIAGAISNDMSRGGSNVCRPGYTAYPWVGLEGAVPAAVMLTRSGYSAFTVSNSALKRAAGYLMNLRRATGNVEWYDADRAPEIKHVLNRAYGMAYPVQYPVAGGRTVGFTDYTHR
jgi:S-layer homology domain